MNVPKLRFKEFKEEWKKNKLGHLCTFAKGNGLSKSDLSNEGKECILYGELYTTYSEIIRKINSYTDKDSSSFIYSKFNDVLIPASGETPIEIAKASCILKENVILGGDLNILSPKNMDGRFLAYQIGSSRKLEFANLSQGHSVVHLYGDKIKNVNIYYPSPKEQEKISNTLELLDKKIELQSKKIEALKLYKLCTKNLLFSNAKTNKTKLKFVLKKWTEKNKNNIFNYVESVSNKYGFISQSEQFEERNIASKDKSNYYVIRKNVFAYNPSRLDIGSLALKDNDLVSLVSPLYECFTTNQNNYFMLEWFNSLEFKKGTFSKFEGGVRNTLDFTNLCEIDISLPSLKEQDKIADILLLFNKKLNYERKKLEKLISLKKGLIQNMFV